MTSNNFINGYYSAFASYLFIERTTTYGSSKKAIIEVGPQVLTLKDVNMRIMSLTKCLFVLTLQKEEPKNHYAPIIKNYEVSIINGKYDTNGIKLANFIKLAFGKQVDIQKENFPSIFNILSKLKGSMFNTVIAHEREIIIKKNNIVIDDSYFSIFAKIHYGWTIPKFNHTPVITKIRTIDKPFYNGEYDLMSLMLKPSEKDKQTLLSNGIIY